MALKKLGLSDELTDGSRLFDPGVIDQLLASEDAEKIAAAVELLDRFADNGLARRIVAETAEGLRAQWLLSAGLRQEVDATEGSPGGEIPKNAQSPDGGCTENVWGELEGIGGSRPRLGGPGRTPQAGVPSNRRRKHRPKRGHPCLSWRRNCPGAGTCAAADDQAGGQGFDRLRENAVGSHAAPVRDTLREDREGRVDATVWPTCRRGSRKKCRNPRNALDKITSRL